MSTRIDFNEFDGSVHLAVDARKGTWANQTLVRGGHTVRTGGQLPTEATAHTLHVVALVTALRDISRAQAAKLVSSAMTGVIKPRLLIVSMDSTFADALTAKMQGQQGKPMRVSKNFLMELPQQLARFTVTLRTEPENQSSRTLRNWAGRSIHDPKAVHRIPPALAATVISAVM